VKVVRIRWLVGIVVLILVAAGVAWALLGSNPRRTASSAGQPTGIGEGGTVTFAGGEPSGFNPNTSKDNGTFVQNVVGNVYPSVFRTHPDLSVRLDSELMDGAELTAERPQTVTYRIRGDAVWSDGTPISAADFVYFWEQQNGTIEDNDVASTAGYQDIGGVTGSADGKTVTVRFDRPFADWQACSPTSFPPTTCGSSRAAGTPGSTAVPSGSRRAAPSGSPGTTGKRA